MRALRFAAVVLISYAVATVARAETPKPTIIVGIPVTFEYTHDAEDPKPKSDSPTGFRVHFVTPFYVGVGVAQYKSALKKEGDFATILTDDLGMTYQFIELTANYMIGPVVLGYGYGSGKVTYDPKTMDFGTFKWTRNDSDAIERFLSLSVHVSPSWSINATWHALYAEVDEEIAATKHKGDIGAIMTTLGIGYSF